MSCTLKNAARLLPAVAAALGAGCVSQRALHKAVTRARAEAGRRAPLVSTNTIADAAQDRTPFEPAGPPLELDLDAALRLTARHSRELQSKREQLYQSALALVGQKRDFGMGLSGTLGYVLESDRDVEKRTAEARLKADRKLPFGGSVALNAGTENAQSDEPDTAKEGYTVTARIEQPVLLGAGYTASHEPLVQARRALLYAMRAFALQRQDFAIRIAEKYYDLLIQQAILTNTERNAKQSQFLRRRSEAMFSVRRAPAIDVLRSQQQELRARNQTSQARAELDIARARFLVELGLPVTTELTLPGHIPQRRPIPLDENTCIQTALQRRLDLASARDRVTDKKRAVTIARNQLLPNLTLYAEARLTADGNLRSGTSNTDNGTLSTGLTLELPLDKRAQRDQLKRATLELDAAKRELDLKRDTVMIEVKENFSRLQALGNAVAIEKRSIEISEKRTRNAVLRFKNGELSNRDVVEAENELLTARNAHVRALADYESQRLKLLRNSGLLDVALDGVFIELTTNDKTEALRQKE